jgi:hypothetical protein
MPLGAYTRLCEMTQERPRDIPGLLLPGADLHSPISVDVSRLMRDDFVTVDLQDGAGCAFPCLWIVEGSHAALERQETGAQRCGVRFSF